MNEARENAKITTGKQFEIMLGALSVDELKNLTHFAQCLLDDNFDRMLEMQLIFLITNAKDKEFRHRARISLEKKKRNEKIEQVS